MKYTLKVGAFIFDSNERERLLLIKEQYRKEDGSKWNIVKGTCDKEGETLEECVRREVLEEVGLNATDVLLRNIIHYGNNSDPKIIFIFSVFVSSLSARVAPLGIQKSLNEDISEACWFSEEEFLKIPKEDFMAQYIYDCEPFSGKQFPSVNFLKA